MRYNPRMKTKPLTFLFALTFLFLFSGSVFGQEANVYKEYYPITKELKSEWHYLDGKLNGLWTEWHKNGQKKEDGQYKDGKENGLWTRWYANGRKELEGNYKDGKKEG